METKTLQFLTLPIRKYIEKVTRNLYYRQIDQNWRLHFIVLIVLDYSTIIINNKTRLPVQLTIAFKTPLGRSFSNK